mmetsp:Transcript_34706/g.81375  ORF Transcript_34706/g.81375 Transcript_34706/m.81375 type:complete len:203 (+) Transcript_34706:50-658(+)
MPEDITYLYTKAQHQGTSIRELLAQRMRATPLPLDEREDRRWIAIHREQREQAIREAEQECEEMGEGAFPGLFPDFEKLMPEELIPETSQTSSKSASASGARSSQPSVFGSSSVFSRLFSSGSASSSSLESIEVDLNATMRSYEEALAASKPRSLTMSGVKGLFGRSVSLDVDSSVRGCPRGERDADERVLSGASTPNTVDQ